MTDKETIVMLREALDKIGWQAGIIPANKDVNYFIEVLNTITKIVIDALNKR